MNINFKNHIKDEVEEKLISLYYNYIKTKVLDKEKILDYNGKGEGNYLCNLSTAFDKKGISIVGGIFDLVVKETYKTEINFNVEEQINEDEYFVSFNVMMDNYSMITNVRNVKLYLYDNEGRDVSELFDVILKESNVDYFKCKVQFQGRVKADVNSTYYGVIDSLELFAEFEVMGIKNDKNPIWIENIVSGTIFAEMGNNRMAFMSYFSALEDFINLAYDELGDLFNVSKDDWIRYFKIQEFEYIKNKLIEENNDKVSEKYEYADKFYGFIFKEMKKLGIDIQCVPEDLENLGYNYEDFIQNELSLEQEKYDNSMLDNTVKDRVDVTEAIKYIQKECEKYSRKDRRLKEKLKDVLKNIGITGDNKDFVKFYCLKVDFSHYEDLRNDIAHGRDFKNEKLEGFLFFVVCIIFTIVFADDFADKAWEYHIFN